jgi:glycerol-3-phosphate dehydrogenase subunit C
VTIADLVIAASNDAVGYSSDECLKCNVCNTVCPVARVTDLFPGPKYVGPQAQRFRTGRARPVLLPGSPAAASPDVTVDWCSGCGLCTLACPAGVKIAEINNQARARMKAGRRPRLRDWGLGQTDLVGRVGVLFSPIANWVLANRPIRALMEVTVGIHREAPFPRFSRRTLQATWKRHQKRRGTTGVPGPDRAVVYFHGCAANYYEPHVAAAAIAILKRNGFETIIPEQVCCGLPLISNGIYSEARERARTNLDVLSSYARQGYRIVGTSTSCTHTIKAEYREVLDIRDDDAAVVANATWDICEFLLDLHEQGRLDTRFGRLDEELPYHAPCQLRSHGIGLPAMELFALVPGLRAVDLDQSCCGIAGTYGMKKEKYPVAAAVGAPLFDLISSSGAAEAACDSETCRWQIEKATGTRTRHPIEILLQAYRAYDAPESAASAAEAIAGA